MRWAITGGAGFLGLHLARRLLADGHEVRTLDLAPLDDAELERAVEELRGDVRDPPRPRALVDGADVLVHAAAALPIQASRDVDPLGERRGHRDGARRRARGRRAPGGADLVDRGLRRAEAPPDRRGRHRSSASATTASRRSRPSRSRATSGRRGLEVVILRPKTFIGPERLGVFEILFDWIREGRRIPILGDGSNRYQLLAVEDLVEATVAAARARRSPARPSTSARPSSAPSAPTSRR